MTDHNPPPSLFSLHALDEARQTHWKAINEIERLLLMPFARIQFLLAGVQWQPGTKLYGLPIIQRHTQSALIIGKNPSLRSSVRSNPLGPNHPCILSTRRPVASLTIGDDFGMTGGSIVCEERITIGNRVWVGCNSVILDTDFHPLDPKTRAKYPLDGATAPVIIEDDVFIGMNVIVLKGVTLGAGCVIGAGSIVTQDIPPGMIAVGNPAKVTRPVPPIPLK